MTTANTDPWDDVFEGEETTTQKQPPKRIPKPKPQATKREKPGLKSSEPEANTARANETDDQPLTDISEPQEHDIFAVPYIQASNGEWYPKEPEPHIKSTMHKWLTPEGLFLINNWARDMPRYKIAARMGIAPPTLGRWADKSPAIAKALRISSEYLDYQVESALLKRAKGYTHKEVQTTIERGKITKVVTTEKHVQPSDNAIQFWLTNRNHDKWHRNRDLAQTLDADGEPINDGNIQVIINSSGAKQTPADREQPNHYEYMPEDAESDSKSKNTKQKRKHKLPTDDNEIW